MPKRKVKLAWITQKSNRCSTFRKRRESILKKVEQLSILCDVKACAIIYDPNDVGGKPETWPSEKETKEILTNFKSMPETEQSNRMLDGEEYVKQRVEKLEDQRRKITADNRDALLTIFLHKLMVGERRLEDLRTEGEAEGLMRVIEQKMKAVRDRMKRIEKGKTVTVDKGAEHDSDHLLPMDDGSGCGSVNGAGDDMFWGCGYGTGNGAGDDLFWGCGGDGDGGLSDVVQPPSFNVADDQRSPWMGYNVGDEVGDGGLEEMIQQACFDVGESSSLMGPSSCSYLDDSWFDIFSC